MTLKAKFEPVQSKRGRGLCASDRHTGVQHRSIEFTRRAEAVAWVDHEAAEWLKTYEGGKYA